MGNTRNRIKSNKMKLSLFIMASAAAQDVVTISNKEKQKVAHLKKSWPKMLNQFFRIPAADGSARQPIGAVRFADKMEYHMNNLHAKIVDSWHTCGRAAMDPEFERMTEDRFDHQNPFKGMTGVTNQYKKFIDNQIHNGCDNQEEQQHYYNKIKLWARLLRFKFCRFVDDSDETCRLDRLQSNPRHQDD